MNRYLTLYNLPAQLSLENAPLLILSGELLMDRFKEDVFVALKLQSISDKRILSVRVKVTPYDAKGNACAEQVEFQYDSLKLDRDDVYLPKKLIPMTDKVRSFNVSISEVVFYDYSLWTNTECFDVHNKAARIKDIYGFRVAQRFAAKYGEDCQYIPKLEGELWYCACGGVNNDEEKRCHSCRRNRSAFERVNFELLKNEIDGSEDSDNNSVENTVSPQGPKKSSKKGIGAVLAIVAVLALAIIVAFSTVKPLRERQKVYRSAEECLASGKYEEARQLFVSLGTFSDAENRAAQDVPYEAACAEFSAAKASGITCQEDIEAYTHIRELFLKLEDYKNSKEKIAEIDEAISAYEQAQIEREYQNAKAFLEKKAWLHASEAFCNLGSYEDAEELAKESLYRRAEAILSFCEQYDTRDIMIFISSSTDQLTIVSMPGAVLTKLGSDVILQLKEIFEEDGISIVYEDVPAESSALPIYTALSDELSRLGEYRDSAELAARAIAAGDYSAEFYHLLRNGKLQEALDWLDTYDDPIEYRELYREKIPMYFSFCRQWTLHQGDSSLIAFSAGVENSPLQEFTPFITIEGTDVTIHIEPWDGSYSATLTAQLGEDRFSYSPDGSIYYYALINQVEHFTYLRYLENGTLLSSCEYRIA